MDTDVMEEGTWDFENGTAEVRQFTVIGSNFTGHLQKKMLFCNSLPKNVKLKCKMETKCA
jgi:hypothetical protein